MPANTKRKSPIYLSEERSDGVCVLMSNSSAEVLEVPCPMWRAIEVSIQPQDWLKALRLLVRRAELARAEGER